MSSRENEAVTCPQCRRPEVHLDCKIGFYCAACDRKFSSEEAKVLVERQVIKAESNG